MLPCLLPAALLPLATVSADAQAAAPTAITVDAAAHRHPISPLIYGVAFASADQLRALNAPLNRSGGNATTQYNWQQNASNHAADWFFESLPEGTAVPGGSVDDFVRATRAGGAQAMVTIPTLGWVAKLGPDRAKLWAFSVAKYGAQQKSDPYTPDAGNGVKPDGSDVTGNDPQDADMPSTPAFQRGWVQHLVKQWGTAAHGGIHYYLMDNEPSLWSSTHRNVHPQGETQNEELRDIIDYGSMVKSLDPNARIAAPEEWGWNGYFWDGADTQYRGAHHYQGQPDRDAGGGLPYIAWLLQQLHQYQQKTGQRLLDVFTVHIYPQGGDGGDDVSPKIQMLRNRSTRSLWNPNYVDESWINDKIMLIPRLKQWVKQYYPGTKIGITEYNWGAENNIGGATAQADILGIFGREGLDLATRWTTPAPTTPTFKAMQLYRNYDGKDSGFGNVSVSDVVPNPDALSSFAAVRSSDQALTVMVVNKVLDGPTPITLSLAHFPAGSTAQVWQLTSANVLTHLPDISVQNHQINAALPAQSVTLLIVPRQ